MSAVLRIWDTGPWAGTVELSLDWSGWNVPTQYVASNPSYPFETHNFGTVTGFSDFLGACNLPPGIGDSSDQGEAQNTTITPSW